MSNSTLTLDDIRHASIMAAWGPDGLWSDILYGIIGGMYISGIIPSILAYPFLLIG